MPRNCSFIYVFLSCMLLCQVLMLTPMPVLAASLIAGGSNHTLSVLADRTVAGWGDNKSGQLGFGKVLYSEMPHEIFFPNSIASVCVTNSHSLALDVNGNVWSWGLNEFGQIGDGTNSDRPIPVIVFQGAKSISASMQISLVLDMNGKVWEWGNGMPSPHLVEGIPVATKIYSGGVAARFAIDQNGRIWAWGDQQRGLLGDGVYDAAFYRDTPSPIEGLSSIRQMAIGTHVLAVDESGQVWAWGQSYGIDGTNAFLLPKKLSGLPAISMVSVGNYENYAIAADGSLINWSNDPSRYVEVSTNNIAYVYLSVGSAHGLAIDRYGVAWGWGSNNVGQLGFGNDGRFRQIQLYGEPVVVVSASDHHYGYESSSLFLTSNGKVYALGSNQALQFALPDGSEISSRSIPQVIPGLHDAISVSARRNTSFAVLSDGSVYGWGDNHSCQFGYTSLNECSPASTPFRITIQARVRKVSFGGLSTLSLDDRGVVWSWGDIYSELGRVGDGAIPKVVSDIPLASDIARGVHHAVILANDGTVWTWGKNYAGQLGAGFYNNNDVSWSREPLQVAGLRGVVSIVAGQNFTAALDQYGTVWTWGGGCGGELGYEIQYSHDNYTCSQPIPRAVSLPAKANGVFAGEAALCATLENGAAHCYGLEHLEFTGKTFGFNRPIIEMSIGGFGFDSTIHFRLADGTVRAYGGGTSGELGTGQYVDSEQPQLVVNENLDNFLDLDLSIPNAIIREELPPFLAATNSEGSNNTVRTISVELNLNDIDLSGINQGNRAVLPSLLASSANPGYNVYVGAIVPAGVMNLSQPSLYFLNSSNGWGQYLGGPLPEFMHNIEVTSQDHRLILRILSSTDVSQLLGTTIYVGYGTSDTEMLQSGRYRAVYTVTNASNQDEVHD